jgi:hypothetical protein
MTYALENGMRGFENIAVTLIEAIFGGRTQYPRQSRPRSSNLECQSRNKASIVPSPVPGLY